LSKGHFVLEYDMDSIREVIMFADLMLRRDKYDQFKEAAVELAYSNLE